MSNFFSSKLRAFQCEDIFLPVNNLFKFNCYGQPSRGVGFQQRKRLELASLSSKLSKDGAKLVSSEYVHTIPAVLIIVIITRDKLPSLKFIGLCSSEPKQRKRLINSDNYVPRLMFQFLCIYLPKHYLNV